jgi:ABC-2 type transport system permease protein
MNAPMGAFTGTRHLVRLILRRDRIRLPIWIIALTAVTGSSAGAVINVYATPREIAAYGATMRDSAAQKMMSGRPVALDTIGGIVSYETTMNALVVTALMVIFLVVRHTRAEEETGRAELLRATVTGRHAATAAAVLVAAGASVVVGALDAAVLLANDLPVGASVLHGAELVGIGLVFTAVAAAAAQVTAGARAALGIAGAVLGGAFLLRGIGDVGDNALTYLSPLGLAQAGDPFGAARWWPILILVLLAAALLAGTAYLTAHRDAGAGLIQPRPGRPRAKPSLGTAAGLAWRLQRGLFLGWSAGLVVSGVLFGSVGPEVLDMVKSNPDLARAIGASGGSILDSYFATTLAIAAVVGTGFGVTSSLRFHSEEAAGRVEPLLATGMSRIRLALGFLLVTVGGTLVQLAAMGLATGLMYAVVAGDYSAVGPLLGAALALSPACLAICGVAVLLTGWWPRATLAVWAVLAFAFLQVYLGELLQLPSWVAAVSPWWHLPRQPLEAFAPATAFGVLAVAVGLGAAGLVGLRRRDIG